MIINYDKFRNVIKCPEAYGADWIEKEGGEDHG